MAALQTIRNHGAALIAVVGLAMLAFIMGDFLNSGSSFFNRGRENVGTIAGHDVHYTEYEAAREQLSEVYKIETGRNDNDEETSSMIRQQVWQMMLTDYTLRAEGKKIGMDITADELSELCIGTHPHQIITSRRTFYGEDGRFNRAMLVQFLASINREMDSPEEEAQVKQAKQYWMYWENATRLTYMQEKVSGLVQTLVQPNSLDAKYAFQDKNVSANVEYAFQPFYTVADSLVKVSNSDIKALYNEKKPLYKQTPNRAISYVAFDIVPSADDYAAAEKLLLNLEEEFKTTDDIALVVNSNSDVMYDGRDYSEETIPAEYKEFAFGKNAKKNDFAPITFNNNTYAMARLVDCGYNLPDSVELKAIAASEEQEDAELGWFQASQLTKEMAEKAFHAKKGEKFTIAQGLNEQTFEVMNISKATPKVKLAVLAREVSASSRTYATIYNNAKQFIVANPTEEAFRAAAVEAGMVIYPAFNLTKNTEKVAQLKSSRAIVRWAFEAKDGQVSDVFECGDQFIVAVLQEINDGEYRSLESVRAELTIEALKNAKANYIIKNLKGVTTVEEAAAKMGQSVKNAENVSLASNRFGNQGNEPAVVGAALALEANETSAPVQGNSGVFVVKTLSKSNAAAEFDAENEKAILSQRYAYLSYQAINSIQQNAKVVDNRANFQ